MKGIFRYCVLVCVGIILVSCSTTSTTSPGPAPGAEKSKSKPSEQKATEPVQGKITIRWQNQSQETYGFNIYRGDSKEGPFTKINKEIISSAGSAKAQKEFVFIDQPLEIGKVFYYYVESVSFAGQKEAITPVTKVVVKTLITESQD